MLKDDGIKKNSGKEKRVNRFALTIITIIDLILFFGYIGDYEQGNISAAFAVTVDLTVII